MLIHTFVEPPRVEKSEQKLCQGLTSFPTILPGSISRNFSQGSSWLPSHPRGEGVWSQKVVGGRGSSEEMSGWGGDGAKWDSGKSGDRDLEQKSVGGQGTGVLDERLEPWLLYHALAGTWSRTNIQFKNPKVTAAQEPSKSNQPGILGEIRVPVAVWSEYRGQPVLIIIIYWQKIHNKNKKSEIIQRKTQHKTLYNSK